MTADTSKVQGLDRLGCGDCTGLDKQAVDEACAVFFRQPVEAEVQIQPFHLAPDSGELHRKGQ